MARSTQSAAPAAQKSRVARKTKAPLTTRENLSALIGSARQILRKDKGLNGDVDRLPLLTWVMFLKFLDDLEAVHEEEAQLDGKRYQPIIEAPYRWRDWAARDDGITGDELLEFMALADYACFNDYEARLLADRTGRSLEHLAGNVQALIVTRGAEGSEIYAAGQRHDIPCVEADAVVDPTGCGDAYRSGLLHGIASGMDWESTGRLAAVMGAIKIAHRGGQNHQPSREEIGERYRRAFGALPW